MMLAIPTAARVGRSIVIGVCRFFCRYLFYPIFGCQGYPFFVLGLLLCVTLQMNGFCQDLGVRGFGVSEFWVVSGKWCHLEKVVFL